MDVSVPMEVIRGKIYLIRGQKVLVDSDLAEMYGVETSNLNKAVKRNIGRFPQDFMFQLTDDEAGSLRFQIGISKRGKLGSRESEEAGNLSRVGVDPLSCCLSS